MFSTKLVGNAATPRYSIWVTVTKTLTIDWTLSLTWDYNRDMNTETYQDLRTLTALDRCDAGQCGAAAKVKTKGLQGELLFCGHHYHKHESALSSWAFETIDERHLKPPVSTHTS